MIKVFVIIQTVWRETLRRKDAYVLLILLLALLAVLMSVDVMQLGTVVGYVKDLGLLLAWVFAWILAVTVSCRQLPQEERQGTIYALLSKPVGRGQLLLGKWLGAWSMVTLATLVFYLSLLVVVALRGGTFGWGVLAQAFLLHAVLLGMVSALGLALSTRMFADAAMTLTFLVSLAAFLILPRVPDLLFDQDRMSQNGLLALYYLLPHFELFDLRQRLVFGQDPLDAATLTMILGYGLSLMALLLTLAWLAYRSKRFSRGERL